MKVCLFPSEVIPYQYPCKCIQKKFFFGIKVLDYIKERTLISYDVILTLCVF